MSDPKFPPMPQYLAASLPGIAEFSEPALVYVEERRLKALQKAAENALEFRAMLERSLLLFRNFAEYEHDEECEPKNDCENGGNDFCFFDEEKDERVHDHSSCDCKVWDAARMATDIASMLKRTMPTGGEGDAR